jgi:hypothetical protein
MSLPSESVTLPGSGLVFINSYSNSVSSQFRTAILTAENLLQQHFVDSLTISVDFDLQSLGSSFAAQNSFTSTVVSYASLVGALRSHATTSDDQLAVASLPASDPSGGKGFELPIAYATMLGLSPQTNQVDLTVTLNSALAWTFGQDAIGALEHEITEGGFGRVGSLGLQGDPAWAPMDLFRFTAGGARDFTGGSDGTPTFFGLDARHVSSLEFHNSISSTGVNDGFDLADWDSTVGDAFGPGGPRAAGAVSATDLQVLDVLGWTPKSGIGFVPAPDDYANSLTDLSHPLGTIGRSGVATGVLEQAGDRDWFQLAALPGFTYQISLTGHTGGGGSLGDPFLRVHDGSGALIASNDDIVDGTNPDSQVSVSPTAGGSLFIEAGAFLDGYAGSYRITVVETVALPASISTAISAVLRASPVDPAVAALSSDLSVGLSAASLSQAQAVADVVHAAQATTSVATMSYEFFTGSAPTSAGMDYLVSPTGGNANNLNAAYYQDFNLENRYINFAVNLGKAGAGAAAFQASYGGLDLFGATKQAYATIFGAAPSDAKVHALLDPIVDGHAETRADYFAALGGDGTNGLGTKAAMVGWLLAEAEKADVGTYAQSNDAFLTDVALHNAPFGVDFVGHYAQAGWVFAG